MKTGDVIEYNFLFKDEETVGTSYAKIDTIIKIDDEIQSVVTEYDNEVELQNIIGLYEKVEI